MAFLKAAKAPTVTLANTLARKAGEQRDLGALELQTRDNFLLAAQEASANAVLAHKQADALERATAVLDEAGVTL